MNRVRCKVCNTEIEAHPSRTHCCGCPNMTTIVGDKVSAVDLSKVVLLNHKNNLKKQPVLSKDDLEYQERRRKRTIRKINFEER